MRDILFRGKCVDNGEWVYGYLGKWPIRGWKELSYFIIPVYGLDDGMAEQVEVAPDTVGQYTGLTDKGGKRIFDGDILRQKRYGMSEEPFSVVWNTDGAGWYFLDEDGYTDELWQSICDSCEIIGNIHDNPDMQIDKGEG